MASAQVSRQALPHRERLPAGGSSCRGHRHRAGSGGRIRGDCQCRSDLSCARHYYAPRRHPLPLTATVDPDAKLVPVSVTGTLDPCVPLLGATDVSATVCTVGTTAEESIWMRCRYSI